MKDGFESLTDREREALRLLGQGHEAKSIAAALDLSVHTVNERLRTARRKLSVSSSREAARLLMAHEAGSDGSENLGYKKIGVAPIGPGEAYSSPAHSGATGAQRRLTWVVIGALMLFVLMSMFLTAHSGGHSSKGAEPVSSLPSLFAVSDYPAPALKTRAQGITDFRLHISDNGRVDKCDIERSSGSAVLDEATCRVIMRRSHFRPATDAAGHPVASVYTGMINWTL